MLQTLPRLFRFPRATARPRRPKRPRARTTVAVGLLAFVAANAILGIVAERYPRLRDPLYGDKFAKLRTKLARPARGPCVVVFGSSRTGFAFNGTIVEERVRETGRSVTAFNFGIPATGPVAHLLYLRRMLAAGVKPDMLVFEILPSMYAKAPVGPSEAYWLFGDRLQGHELSTVERFGFDSRTVRNRWRESTYLPFYGLRFQIIGRTIQSWIPWQLRYDWSRSTDACGWGTPYRDVLTPDEKAHAVSHARAEYFAVLQCWQLGDESSTALRELLAECRQAGIPTKLVLMPEGTEFRSWYPPHVLVQLDAFLKSTGCEVIDARTWLDDGDFTDGHHQLRGGAKKFSWRVTDEVILPWLNGK